MRYFRTPESSNIYAVGYDPSTKQLEVWFTSGALYAYEDVSPVMWASLTAAPSVGKWLVVHIKGVGPDAHPYTRTDRPIPQDTDEMTRMRTLLATVEERLHAAHEANATVSDINRTLQLERDQLVRRNIELIRDASDLRTEVEEVEQRWENVCNEVNLRDARINALEEQLTILRGAVEDESKTHIH